MKIIKYFGKFLDQPRLVNNFTKTVPAALSAGAGYIVLKESNNTPVENRKRKAIQSGLTMFGAVASSLYAPKISSKIFRTAPKFVSNTQLTKNNTQIIDTFLSNNLTNEKTGKILEKAKSNILSIKEIKQLSESLKTADGKALFKELIPEPENITSNDIFSEIGRLSVYGLIPVLGGIAGGIAGDKLTDSDYKAKIPNKIKEGAYQYLANIFLCNIGAGTALGILEKCNIKSKSVRALGMVSGIILTGVIGGSKIANYIGKHFINRCFKDNDDKKRKPEVLDICLHADDIATVAVMSGLKWIEPALPILYAISGYRAGMGYRGKENTFGS